MIGTGSSGVQITAALSSRAASLDVYQRTPAWMLPKPDAEIPPLRAECWGRPASSLRFIMSGRLVFDLAMLAPIVHIFSRLPDRLLVR